MSKLCGSLNNLWHCLLWDWNENWPFPVLWPLLSFPDLLAYWVQHTYGGKQRRPEEPLDDSERGEWKAGVKLNIQKIKIMASGHITSWQIDGETVETVADFILGVSKSTADGDCSHEIKRCLLLGRKAMTNLDRILKSRDYFANKGLSSQGYGFSSGHVWMWELDCEEGWASKESMLLNCGVGEDSWESLGLQGDPTSLC